MLTICMHSGICQDSSEKIMLQGRPLRGFSGHCDACSVLKLITNNNNNTTEMTTDCDHTITSTPY